MTFSEVVQGYLPKLGNEANSPYYIFNEPRVGYRMPEGGTQGPEGGQTKALSRLCVPPPRHARRSHKPE